MRFKARQFLRSGAALTVWVAVLSFTLLGCSPATSDALYQKHRVAFDVLDRRAQELESFINARWVIGEVEFGFNGAYARQHDGSWSPRYGPDRDSKLTLDEMLTRDSLTVDEFNACQALIQDIPANRIEITAGGDFATINISLSATPSSIWWRGTSEGIVYLDRKHPGFPAVSGPIQRTKLDDRWYLWQESRPRSFIAH